MLVCVMMVVGSAWAESPLPTAPIWQAYRDVPAVSSAAETGVLDEAMAQALTDPDVSLDTKAAVISALAAVDVKGDNAPAFERVLAQKYGTTAEVVGREYMSLLEPEELFLLGYLVALDDPATPQRALPMLTEAERKRPKSDTVAVISGLVAAQTQLDTGWCDRWQKLGVVGKKPKQRELRPEAKVIAAEAVAGTCPG